jgi:hypothetical protein
MVCRWFEAADLVGAEKTCRLKLLPDVDVENIVARLNTEASIATSLAAERRPPRDDRKRKLRAIARTAEDLLGVLGLPRAVPPSQALSTGLLSTVAAALQPGLLGVRMPFSKQLISLVGGAHELVNASVLAKQIAEAAGQDATQAASRATDRRIAQAALALVPVALATLRETAERAHAIVAVEPKRRLRGNTAGMRALLLALAGAHKLLFGHFPKLRDREFGRDTPSLRWTKAVIEASANRLVACPNADASAQALFAKAASLSLATLSDALQTSLRAGLRANSA